MHILGVFSSLQHGTMHVLHAELLPDKLPPSFNLRWQHGGAPQTYHCGIPTVHLPVLNGSCWVRTLSYLGCSTGLILGARRLQFFKASVITYLQLFCSVIGINILIYFTKLCGGV